MNAKYEHKGVIVPLLTPLNQDYTLDVSRLTALVGHLIASGVHGVFVMGSAGEGTNVAYETWRAATRATLQAAEGRVPVYCGAITPGTLETIERIREVEDLGGTIAVATPPFYMPNADQDVLLRHYETIAERTNTDLVIYGHTGTTHTNIAPASLRRLAANPRFVAFKDTRSDFEGILADLMALEGTTMRLLSGGEAHFGASILMGAAGNICGLANIVPELCLALYEAACSGDVETTSKIQRQLQGLNQVCAVSPVFISGLKYLARILGLCEAYVAPPSLPLTIAQKEQVRQIAQDFDVPIMDRL